MTTRKLALVTVALGMLVGLGIAHAEVSKQVQKKFSGQILFSEEPLPDAAETPAKTIELFKKLSKDVLRHGSVEDGVATWSFYFTAFLKKAPGVTGLSVDFHTTDGKYVANKRLMGIDPKLTVLASDLRITEDDGLTRGKTYQVKLTGTVRGKEVVFAEGKVQMN